ncbi:hypothetical protein LCGC14_1272630 [marine sediment metagenome]|uniref:Uncharacterized protein n=1 Tax=marine sediment metagenome TaxID=412755 RepID=A0A0F9NE88_9ZZZZ
MKLFIGANFRLLTHRRQGGGKGSEGCIVGNDGGSKWEKALGWRPRPWLVKFDDCPKQIYRLRDRDMVGV